MPPGESTPLSQGLVDGAPVFATSPRQSDQPADPSRLTGWRRRGQRKLPGLPPTRHPRRHGPLRGSCGRNRALARPGRASEGVSAAETPSGRIRPMAMGVGGIWCGPPTAETVSSTGQGATGLVIVAGRWCSNAHLGATGDADKHRSRAQAATPYSWWNPPRIGRLHRALVCTGRTGGNQRAPAGACLRSHR